ncbi:TniQ family protein [Streptantibioticus ferralitis]|uniref:TniQ family protein n=1 Tax=Streptantibioticus ferralitis TaxID=236510 RepID=A0ABT5YWN6_9ACTN|nr:TniQ family protein [Streptantibioticus ferralitis]MDF2256012.1 TniQ family protein [Streptantibioticus ferralitis]
MNLLRRWPLHPQPGPLEALSSWLGRLAELYEMPVHDLLLHNLGLVGLALPGDLDLDPPMAMLAVLAEKTGVELARLRSMTLAGWVPWLFDTLPVRVQDAQQVFDTYVRDNSVLFARKAGTHHVLRFKPEWAGPWLLPYPGALRACPVCAADPGRGISLVWRLALISSCVEHDCRLLEISEVRAALILGREMHREPLEAPRAALDRYTHQALTTGRVALPGRNVHAGVWFRLLRSLLDEVSLATSTQGAHGKDVLRLIWQTTGHPERAGLNVWRPFEQLRDEVREAMWDAAAAAVQLAADGLITVRGRLASALQTPLHSVYGGDEPSPLQRAWQDVMDTWEEALASARTDPASARQLLGLLTGGCRTLAAFEQERSSLCGEGIPAGFLPSARELGRHDLI